MMLYGQLYVVPQFLRGVQQHSAWGVGKLETIDAVAFTFGLYIGALTMSRIGLRTSLGNRRRRLRVRHDPLEHSPHSVDLR